MARRQPTENTRLLPLPSLSQPPSPVSSNARRCLVAAVIINLLLSSAGSVQLVAKTAILQSIICEKYHAQIETQQSPAPPLDRCKAAPVQAEIAFVLGWQEALEVFTSLLLTIPYALLAERIGRKKILLLSLAGIFMNDAWVRLIYWFHDFFPVRLIWLGGLWQILGAGNAMLSSQILILVAQSCNPEHRTTAFSRIQSAWFISILLFIPLGGILANINPWIPMFMSSAFQGAGFLATMILVPAISPHNAGNNERNLVQEFQESSYDDVEIIVFKHSLRQRIGLQRQKIASLTRWMARNVRVLPVVMTFFLFLLGEQGHGTLLLQYASKRLGWSLSEASYLISMRALIKIAILLLVVPFLSTFFTRSLDLPVMAGDKLIAQGTGVLLVSGFAMTAFATSPTLLILGQVLCSFGNAFIIPVRSLVTNLVDPDYLGATYAAIEMLIQSGVCIGQPLLAAAFGWGMQLGPLWTGLAYLIGCATSSIAVMAISTCPVYSNKSQDRLDAVHDDTLTMGQLDREHG